MSHDKADYPLIREIELGKSINEFLTEHFHEDAYQYALTLDACARRVGINSGSTVRLLGTRESGRLIVGLAKRM
jgi:hypothetical protein